MKRIAITGGIGSGKSYVCSILRNHGITIYDCDSAAKRLMNESDSLKQALCSLVGEDTYVDGKLNKAVMAAFILASDENKAAVNAIVHPAVIEDFHNSGLTWMECAILYEAKLEYSVDYVVAVTAPDDVRIKRIMKRDSLTEEKAKAWLEIQMPQEEVVKRADFTIVNDGTDNLNQQIELLLQTIHNVFTAE